MSWKYRMRNIKKNTKKMEGKFIPKVGKKKSKAEPQLWETRKEEHKRRARSFFGI